MGKQSFRGERRPHSACVLADPAGVSPGCSLRVQQMASAVLWPACSCLSMAGTRTGTPILSA